ncbi:MAG: family 10 glycosylhydrolase [Lachnospiraceae bacterium]|nr:family 10 glycosylhydrolase [Lachnospiraceae bacterium]
MFFKKIAAGILAAAIAVTSFTGVSAAAQVNARAAERSWVRGVWLSIYDYSYSGIGLYTDSESTFRTNADKFIAKIKEYNLNTIYMQVRANDDAAWKSSTFTAMEEISPSANSLAKKGKNTRSASKTLKFDPLKIMVEEAHKNDVDLIAWMNPYRRSSSYFLNPGATSSINRVNTAVKEVMKYDVDGVIFDDYFYHAGKGYWNQAKKKVTLTADRAAKLSKSTKAKNVNKLIKKVHSTVHKADNNATFGVAPQGNLTNDEASGADVNTWASEDGYVDYIMPQIYWTDDYGKKGGTTMFTDRLNQFTGSSVNKNGKVKYIALALYRCGYDYSTDHGWKNSDTNLAEQYEALKDAGCTGYSLFSARFLYLGKASDELGFLNESILQ